MLAPITVRNAVDGAGVIAVHRAITGIVASIDVLPIVQVIVQGLQEIVMNVKLDTMEIHALRPAHQDVSFRANNQMVIATPANRDTGVINVIHGAHRIVKIHAINQMVIASLANRDTGAINVIHGAHQIVKIHATK